MKLPQFAVKRPVTTAMIFLGVVILGVASLAQLGLDLMPDIEVPTITVITTYSGAAPEDIETTITKPVEEQLSTVANVDEVTSFSREGSSTVVLKFQWGVNLDEATNDVRDKLDLAKAVLPEEADEPFIFKFDMAMIPLMYIGVTAKESYTELEHIIDKKILDPLKQIPGVATAISRGGLKRQILVHLDRQRMEALRISTEQVTTILKDQNLSTPGGHIRMGEMDYLIRTPEEFSDPEEIGRVVAARREGVPIRLNDFAEVRDAFEEQTLDVRMNQGRGMVVIVYKQSGTNTVEIAKRVTARLTEIRKAVPPDVKIDIAWDSSDFIRGSITNLKETLMWAGIIVFAVVMLFLRNLRGSLIIATSIPVALVITFILMYAAGYTINMMTLSSLAIAIGMVVDNAIVALDNIHRHRERGQRPVEAAIFGASEMGRPILASTLTTVAIFVPIVFVGGVTTIMFGEMALVISFALLASFMTAMMLVPMLASKYLRVESSETKKGALGSLLRLSERGFVKVEDLYGRLLGWALTHKGPVIYVALLMLVTAGAMAGAVGTSFMPQMDQNLIQLEIELPVGTRFERTGEICILTEQIVREKIPETEMSFVRWGVPRKGELNPGGVEETSYTGRGMIRVISKNDRDESLKDIVERVRPYVENIPGAIIRFSTEDPIENLMFGGGKPLRVDLYGDDMEAALRYADAVAATFRAMDGVADVDISRKAERPERQMVVDRDAASEHGLDARNIGKTIETYFSGSEAGKYREGGDEYDIFVRLRERDRLEVDDIERAFVTADDGSQILIASFAQVKPGLGPTKIERKNQERVITVSANIYGRDLGSVVAEADKRISQLEAPPGFTYRFGGAKEEQEKSFQRLLIALVLGMVLVYMVMASQFESLRDPFLIFLSIPFAMTGAIWALVATGQTLSLLSFLGVIMLVGIVVNNGIVLISYMNILRERGLSVRDAVTQGGHSRLRPVLMTTFSTALGLTPLALSTGEGAEMWVPLAVTVIGGLLVSTLVTLIFIPTLYSIFETRRAGRKNSAKVIA
ncbi:MAG: efflux RND transporter permease subunit [Planctomycetia bacterium]|nr:efflux RND transporter permease subunit [Planctomycetia bacterium]